MMTRNTKFALTASALFLALFVGRPDGASAAIATHAIPVTANVVAACTITASPLAFGAYDPFASTPLDVNAPLNFACTKSLTAWIGLDNVGTRSMVNGASSLPYEIYTGAQGTSPLWGNTAATGVSVTGTGSTDATSAVMHGRISPNMPGLISGAYSQSIQATINF